MASAEVDVAGVSRLRRDWWDMMRGVSLEEWIQKARERHRPARLVKI
jgi:hypothetical protein